MSSAFITFEAFILGDGSSTKKIGIYYDYAKTMDGLEIVAYEPALDIVSDCDDYKEDFRLTIEENHEIASIEWL